MDSADPDGNGEVSDDCNGNGIPDDCDLDPLDPDGDGEISIDCNGNDVPDECEIADCPPNTPFCDDCNLNGVLDGCDIDPADPDGNGEVSEDVDPTDGVPDECVHLIEGDVNWTDDIWDLDAQYPDNDEGNPDGVPDLHVTLTGVDTVVFLDETVATDTLRIQDGATLQVTQTTVGDLTLEDPGGLLVEGILLAANRRIIDVTAGVATIGLDGIYQADPAAGGLVSAVLQSGDIVVQGGTSDEFGGVIELTGSMELISLGDLSLESNETDKGGGDCKGSGTPPDFNSTDGSRGVVSGNFEIGRCAAVSITSTQHMAVGGDLQNQSIAPLDFNWETGGLLMNGPGHLIEAAGEDRGPWPIGLEDNFAIGTLTLAPAAIVQVVDEFDNQQDGVIACDEALYVDTLVVGSGAVLLTDGCRVYYNVLTNDGAVPGLGIDVLEIREPIAPDLDGNGEVDAFDLASLLGSWGPCPPEDDCPADVDGDGDVDAFDLASLLGVWGPVP
jgi:hypothetical protein